MQLPKMAKIYGTCIPLILCICIMQLAICHCNRQTYNITNLYCDTDKHPWPLGNPGKFFFRYSWREFSSNLCSVRTGEPSTIFCLFVPKANTFWKPEEPWTPKHAFLFPGSSAMRLVNPHNALWVSEVPPSWNFARDWHSKIIIRTLWLELHISTNVVIFS